MSLVSSTNTVLTVCSYLQDVSNQVSPHDGGEEVNTYTHPSVHVWPKPVGCVTSESGKWLVGPCTWRPSLGLVLLHLQYRVKPEEETLFSDLLSYVSCDHKAQIKLRFYEHLADFHVKLLLSLSPGSHLLSPHHFISPFQLVLPYVAMVTVILSIHFICHPLTHLSVMFSFCPPCASSSVVSVFIESVVSSSAHPGGARAPSGGRDCECAAGPGPPQTPHHHDDNHSRALWQHLDNAAATAHAQWALCENGVREESRILD